MNGKNILLILAHLFRMEGEHPSVDDAVEFLSFKCRYGTPSNIRRMLTLAIENEMISLKGDQLSPEFLYNKQNLSPNQAADLEGKVIVSETIKPLN
jgi:hypothetical protein